MHHSQTHCDWSAGQTEHAEEGGNKMCRVRSHISHMGTYSVCTYCIHDIVHVSGA